MARLAGQKALVTGGGAGFGRAIAAAFAQEGAEVLIVDRDGAAAEAAAREVGGEAFAADITRAEPMAEAVRHAETVFGGLSLLVANTGIGQRPRRASETSVEEMRRQFEVNALGAAISAEAALPALRRHGDGASILFTVSGIALTPRPEFCAYGMAKSATAYLMKSLALDLAPEGIRVNGLFPAISGTAMFAEFADGDLGKKDAFAAALPLGRLVTPEDVAAAAVFLSSPSEAGAMTGCALPVDAGRTI